MYVSDLRHFLDAHGEIARGTAAELALYFARIVAAATCVPPGSEVRSEIRCRRRPGRRRCDGAITTRCTEMPAVVEWVCPSCEDQGTISGWEGTCWDRRFERGKEATGGRDDGIDRDAQRAVSYGACGECGTRTSKGAMLAHLRKCIPSLDAHSRDAVPLLLLRAESPGLRMFWLDVAIRADASLAQLDRILRDTWLECCGHLIAFRYGGLVYMTATDDPYDRHRGERGMNAPVTEVFRTKGHKVVYEYDFGSTTARRSG